MKVPKTLNESKRTLQIFFFLSVLILVPACEQDVGSTNLLTQAQALSLSTSGSSTSLTQTPSSGTGYSQVTVSVGSGDFYATNLCSGKQILGLSGTAYCQSCNTQWFSSAARGNASTRITTSDETGTYSGTALPSNYHSVPLIDWDDEGACTGDLPTSTCAYRTNIQAIPGSVHNAFMVCGKTQTTIAARIADCASVNGTAWTTWDGLHLGSGAESVWKLVTVAGNTGGPPYGEVWLDTKTNHLWSSRSAAAVPSSPAVSPYTDLPAPWCAAAGNDNNCDPASSTPCGTTNQNYCTHNQTSYCSETLYPTPRPSPSPVLAGTSFTGDSYSYSASTYGVSKGAMGYYSTPSVHWRLPSLSEYDIADVDGIRYVMGDMGGLAGINDQEWTATLDSFSSNRRNAFTFSSMKGTVSSQDRATTTVYARCVAAVTSSTGPFSGTTNTINKPAYYSRPINITTTAPTLSNSSLPFYLDTAALISASKMNASCTNMRFTDSNGNSAPFYLDSGCNTSSTLVWVRVPGFTSSTSLNWYYGLLTTGTSDFNGTFPSSYTATATTGYVGTATYDSFSVPASTFVAGATGTPVYVTANRIAISGSINVTGAGYPGAVAVSTAGSGPGGGSAATTFGGAGAGYGGAGGCGQTSLNVCNSTAGTTYGNSSALPTNAATLKDSMGSGGGGGSADSGLGNGGGAVILVGKVVKVAGTIVGNGADGNKASIASGSQGGGSGGTIQFSADTALSLTGTLSVNGGRPGNGYAGGGGGGRIKILSPATPVIPTVDTSTKNFLGATTDSSGTSIGNVSARGSNGGTNSGTTTNATTYTLGSETQTTITSP